MAIPGTAGNPVNDVFSIQGVSGGVEVPVSMAAVPPGGATAAKQQEIIDALATLAGHVDGLEGFTDALEGFTDGIESLLTTISGLDYATQTTLAAILAKLIASPATEAKQDTLIAKDFATQATLAAILAKLIAAPATEAAQVTSNAYLAALVTALTSTVTGFIATSQSTINDTVVKASAGTLISVNASNTHANNWVYLKFYNKSTVPDPSGGVDYPVTTLVIPPASKVHLQIPTNGIPFSSGIAYVTVGGYADNDETAVALGQVQISGTYL